MIDVLHRVLLALRGGIRIRKNAFAYCRVKSETRVVYMFNAADAEDKASQYVLRSRQSLAP